MASSRSTSVIIVGGGPVGLSSSILLSLRGIPHLMFEKYPGTSIHPKACGINQRTTEIFRVMGIEDEIYQHAAPPEIAGRTAWYTSFGPSGREIVSRDAWGGGEYAGEYATFSPSRYCILPQIRLEPILKRRALELNPTGVFYNAEVLGVEEEGKQVNVEVLDKRTGETVTHRSRFVFVADGGRSFTEKLGVEWMGESDILDMVTAHFSSPLKPHHPDPHNFITWFTNPKLGGSTRTGYLYQIGPWPVKDPEHEEWVFACARSFNDPATFDKQSMTQRLRETLDLPDLPVKMHSVSHWTVNAVYASKWRVGRSFLLGDSAHKIPPWGALGMNSGIQDAQNLVWKIELALQDEEKYDGLLDTYESERLEVGRRVGQTSLHNMRSHSMIMDQALGFSDTQSVEENERALGALLDPSHAQHVATRKAVEQAQKTLDCEFHAPGLENGWFYPSMDISNEGGESHDGQRLPNGSLNTQAYFPTTIPGHHLPHCELEWDGDRIPVRDLISLDKLVLFTRDTVPKSLSDERLRCIQIGTGACDMSKDWQTWSGVGEDGGVLVRPDGIIAWRGGLSSFTTESWRALIDRILHYQRKTS
jgi:2-polyprenyl-6-methoxyphenol hydroxylase-like FAD-dependent oxidoreductase